MRTVLALCLVLTGCGRYADFTLPVLQGAAVEWPKLSFEAQPVLLRGSASDVLNPSVVEVNGELLNFYSVYDGGVWKTALAKSSDGVHWTQGEYVLWPDAQSWEAAYIAGKGADA